MDYRGTHILSTTQFQLSDLDRLFTLADALRPYAEGKVRTRVLEGAVLVNLFFEPSTRSRISFGVAFNRLGGHVRDTTGVAFSSMAKGESLEDTARVIGGYGDIAVLRHPEEGAVATFAGASTVPVINGGDGPGEHPTQAILDLYTMTRELSRPLRELSRSTIVFVGDLKYGRTVHSLARLLGLLNAMRFICVAPPAVQLPEHLRSALEARGHRVELSTDLDSALAAADVVYSTRIQQERYASPADAEAARGRFSINRERFDTFAPPHAVILHPLPRDSRPEANELDDDLTHHPRLAVFRQADNGIPTRMALFALVLGVEDDIDATRSPVKWHRNPQR